MKYKIALIPGDGIGPEVIGEAVKVMNRIADKYGREFIYDEITAGGASIDAFGIPLTDVMLERVKNSDAVLLAAVGGAKWDGCPERPEKALLRLRYELGAYANLRPAKLFKALEGASPLKEVGQGIDIMLIRELTGGLYYGERGINSANGELQAYDTLRYSESEINRILEAGFRTSIKRRKHVTVVDKSNILDTSRLWRKCAESVAEKYPDVSMDFMYVDNAAMQLVLNPDFFDVIVTENTFGDILSDEAGAITGSIGLLPSASLGDGIGIYEPVHGSAPDIAGQDRANPIAMILSAAMMLRHSFSMEAEASAIENAVEDAINKGLRTVDIAAGGRTVGTREMGEAIASGIG